jgi:hypothetical protein
MFIVCRSLTRKVLVAQRADEIPHLRLRVNDVD